MIGKRKIYILSILAVTFISMFLFIEDQTNSEGNLTKLTRPDPVNRQQEVSLTVSSSTQSEQVDVSVEPRDYTDAEWSDVSKRVFLQIEQNLKLSNQEMITEIDGFPGEIEWEISKRDQKEYARATLMYNKRTATKEFLLSNLADQDSKLPISERVREMIEKQVNDDPAATEIQLPSTIDGERVSYKINQDDNKVTIVFLYASLLLLPLYFREREKKRCAAWKKQMLLDYPNIVNQLALLINAGLTVRKALNRISIQYEENRKKGFGLRAGFEELGLVNTQIQQGLPERKAIEHWGRKVQLIQYMRLSTLLCQNLTKGSHGLVELLEIEAVDAFAERKELVKKLGEEAGTKLLIPMMILFGIVMAMLIVPAITEI